MKETTELWDVAELIESYYAMPHDQWFARYRPRMETKLSPNKPAERMAAGGLFRRLWVRLVAAIAHFFR